MNGHKCSSQALFAEAVVMRDKVDKGWGGGRRWIKGGGEKRWIKGGGQSNANQSLGQYYLIGKCGQERRYIYPNYFCLLK